MKTSEQFEHNWELSELISYNDEDFNQYTRSKQKLFSIRQEITDNVNE